MIRGPRAETALTYSQTLNGQDVYVCLNFYVNIAHNNEYCYRRFKYFITIFIIKIRVIMKCLVGLFW